MDKRRVANQARLVEPIVRQRVQDSLFYKQHLHLTNEQSLLPVVVEHVRFVGGPDAANRPSPFLCCLVRMLEIEPAEEIVALYLRQNGHAQFKYLTALALAYCRMVWPGAPFHALFDEYIGDYRKLRWRHRTPEVCAGHVRHYTTRCMDEWVDDLATQERVVGVRLPYMAPRGPRVYGVESDASEHESDSD